MKYKKTLLIIPSLADTINRYLREEPKDEAECFGEDSTITKTVVFDNGVEMDIKCCGVQFTEGEANLAWTEAVLFQNGSQLCCTDPSDEYLGEWMCEYDGDEYIVNVEVAKQIIVTDIDWDAPKEVKLPKRVVIDIDKNNEYLLETDADGSHENLSDYLSDTYEYCHNGFRVKFATKKTRKDK